MKLGIFVPFLAVLWLYGPPQSAANIQRQVGIRLLSYVNVDGKLPDGSCCDGQSLTAGAGCLPDTCDTVFVYCLTRVSDTSFCVANLETTPVVNNNTITEFGSRLDPHRNDSTPSLVAMSASTMEELEMKVVVAEVNPPYGAVAGTVLGVFHLPITPPTIFQELVWHTHHVNNSVVSLGINLTSFCNNHFYGSACDILCKPTDDDSSGHYVCDDQGKKICNQGYEGDICNDMIDLCVVSGARPLCHNGGTCHPVLNNFTCACAPGFTGRQCDVRSPTNAKTTLPITSPMSPSPSPSPSPSSSSSSSASSSSSTTTTTKTTTTTTTTASPSSPNAKPLSTPTLTPSATKKPPSKARKQRQGIEGDRTAALVLGPLAAGMCIAVASAITYKLLKRKRERNVKPNKLEEEGSQESVVKTAWGDPPTGTPPSPPQSSAVPTTTVSRPWPVRVEW